MPFYGKVVQKRVVGGEGSPWGLEEGWSVFVGDVQSIWSLSELCPDRIA
jgi:hypothetical protein